MLNRFQKKRRVLSSPEFKKVLNQGRKKVSKHFVFFFLRAEHARLGLIASRRRVPRAVDRNRLKRVLRESFRTHKNPASGDFVVLLRGSAVRAESSELFRELEKMWDYFR